MWLFLQVQTSALIQLSGNGGHNKGLEEQQWEMFEKFACGNKNASLKVSLSNQELLWVGVGGWEGVVVNPVLCQNILNQLLNLIHFYLLRLGNFFLQMLHLKTCW